MAITFCCPACDQSLRLKDEFAGKRGKCPKCQATIQVPELTAATSAAPLAAIVLPDPPGETSELSRHAGLTPGAAVPATTPRMTLPTPAASQQSAATSSPQQTFQQVMAGFQGEFTPRGPSLAYRLGALLTAAFMVLLPLLYVSLIVLVGAVVFWHLANNHWIMGAVRGRAMIVALLIYAAPVLVGVILLVFMTKPLFNWSSSESRSRSINRESDPLLFAFVSRICEVVRAPKPVRIELDCDINASARFDAWGVLTNRLVLRIGMPLVATLSLQQLAGVLAHEFGHFSQGTGMRLTYVIRTINHWFVRVVYERDAWDDWLVETAAENDLRFSWILYLAMFFVWITRKILWVLMVVGHAVAGMMLRQMEFDADTYEARLAGSESFAATARRLRLLGIAWEGAKADLGNFYRDGRLVDNLPKLIVANLGDLPKEFEQIVDKMIAESKTGWFDTHPSDRERIAAAKSLQAAGIFHSDLPAHVLLRDFNAASKGVTWDYYCEIFGSRLRQQDLHSVDELIAQQHKEVAYKESLRCFFGGHLPLLRPLAIPDGGLAGPDASVLQDRLAACRKIAERDAASYAELYKQYDELDTQLVHALQSYPLLACGLKPVAVEGRPTYRSTREASQARDRAQTELAKLGNRFESFEAAMGERLLIGLRLAESDRIGRQIPEIDSLRRQSRDLLPLVKQIASFMGSFLTLRNNVAVLTALFSQIDGNQRNPDYIREVLDQAGRVHTQVAHLWDLFRHAQYPFDHAKGPMTVSAYLLPVLPPSDEVGMIYEAAEGMISNLSSLYGRSLARLCDTATAVENVLGYQPLSAC